MVVPFRKRNRLGTMIHSIKHVVEAEGNVVGSARSIVPLSTTVQARTDPFNPVELVLGENVNGIFLSVFAIGSTGSGQDGAINWYIAKGRSGQNTSADFPPSQSVGVSEVRSQIFHQEKGLAGSADGTPMVFKGVIVVPKHMRRQREGDSFFFVINNTDATNGVNFCVRAIYKSFS